MNCAIWVCNSNFSRLRFLFSSRSSWWLLFSSMAVMVFSSEAFRYAGKILGSHFFLVISTSKFLHPFWNFSCLNSHLLDDVFLHPCFFDEGLINYYAIQTHRYIYIHLTQLSFSIYVRLYLEFLNVRSLLLVIWL